MQIPQYKKVFFLLVPFIRQYIVYSINMNSMFKSAKRGTFVFLAKRYDPLAPLRRFLPEVFFLEINLLPYLKKAGLLILIGLIIVSFVITSMPHIFLT